MGRSVPESRGPGDRLGMAGPMVADRLARFGTSIFAAFTRLANEHGAVNLAQGFPDFDGPEVAKEAAIAAIRSGVAAQYSPTHGVLPLREAIARDARARGLGPVDPETDVTVTCGCSEAIVAALLGLMNPGDAVAMFEPYFDFYGAAPALGGFESRRIALRASGDGSGFVFDAGELERALTGARVLLFNSPHNPTGKVFTREELGLIAGLCERHGVIAIADDVYEHLAYEEDRPHIPLASLPGMWERTVTLSSVGKTFSLTGWKVGWAIAPARLTAGIRAAHQFITFATNAPLQHGVAAALPHAGAYAAELRGLFRRNRDALSAALREVGMRVHPSHGTYFLMADHTPISGPLGLEDDHAFCRWLTREVGVAAIPPTAFCTDASLGRSMARFAYCKRAETMGTAIERLGRVRALVGRAS